MKVKPPVGQGRVRLVRIGAARRPSTCSPAAAPTSARRREIGPAPHRQGREEGPGEPPRQPALRRLTAAMAEGPMALYRRKVAEGALGADPAQRLAVEKLQLLAMRLADYNPAAPKRVGLGLFGWGRDRLEEKPVPGLYLYGGVGRGKSMLMDLFFDAAPVEPEAPGAFPRLHAGDAPRHRRRARRAAPRIRSARSPTRSPTARRCSASTRCRSPTSPTRCWSGRLFERLFERGVVVVTTSNRHARRALQGRAEPRSCSCRSSR